jgi:hypothetical protein
MRKLVLFTVVAALLFVFGIALASDWNRLDPPNSPRPGFGHSMVGMPDGSILIFGGEDAESVNNDLFFYRRLDWNSVSGDGPEGRTGHATWVGQGGQYVLGGKGSDGRPLNDFWVFDPAAGDEPPYGQWERIVGVELPPARYNHTATPLQDGRVLICGGIGPSGEVLSDCWIFDPRTRRFTRLSCPDCLSRAGHTIVTLPDGKAYLWGGQDGEGNPQADLLAFEYGNWHPVTQHNTPAPARQEHVAWPWVIDGQDYLYIHGGLGDTHVLGDLWRYALDTGLWSRVFPGGSGHPVPMSGHACATLPDGNQLFFGGVSFRGTPLGDTWELTKSSGDRSGTSLPGVITTATATRVHDEPPYEPIGPTTEFTTTGQKIYSWVRLEDLWNSTAIRWEWLDPNGEVRSTYTHDVPDPDSQGKESWSWYVAWSWIDLGALFGARLTDARGSWTVSIYLDDLLVLTSAFTVG